MPSYLITGASRGLGLEFVRQIAARPDTQVFALVRNKNTATELQELASSTKNVYIVESDILDYKKLKFVAAEVAEVTGGSLDVLINNAAFVDARRRGLFLDQYPGPDTDALVESDLLEGKGSLKKVVTISSGVGDLDLTVTLGSSDMGAYCISKAAVNMVNAKYAARFKNDGFVFLALSPGLVDTYGPKNPPNEEELAGLANLVAALQTVAPDFKGPIQPEESVRLQLEVIDRWTAKNSGAFVSHHGNKQWL